MRKLTLAVFLSAFIGCGTAQKLPPVIVAPYKPPVIDPKPIKVSVQTARGIFALRAAYDELKTKVAELEFYLKGCEFKGGKK